ncbi:MAG: MerR family transcriptional regulator [Clostridia bacterium]
MYILGTLKPQEFANSTGVSVRRLQYLDKIGAFKAYRTNTNRRFYLYEDVNRFNKLADYEKTSNLF